MRDTLFASPEGWILGIGLTLASLMFLALGIGWHLFLDSVLTYTAMTRLNLTIGRAAGMIFGYASGLGHAQVVPLNTLVQTIQVLVVYPLFVLSSRQLIRVPPCSFFLHACSALPKPTAAPCASSVLSAVRLRVRPVLDDWPGGGFHHRLSDRVAPVGEYRHRIGVDLRRHRRVGAAVERAQRLGRHREPLRAL